MNLSSEWFTLASPLLNLFVGPSWTIWSLGNPRNDVNYQKFHNHIMRFSRERKMCVNWWMYTCQNQGIGSHQMTGKFQVQDKLTRLGRLLHLTHNSVILFWHYFSLSLSSITFSLYHLRKYINYFSFWTKL